MIEAVLEIPKPRRIRDPKAMDRCRARGVCEWSGRTDRLHVHHIKSRGSGGGDTDDNLILLHFEFHEDAHAGRITKDQLRAIVARRNQS